MNNIKLLILILAVALIAILLNLASSKTLYEMASFADEFIFIDQNYFTGNYAVVNIFCNTAGTDYITATGVIVDPRGYILSNAHIAKDIGDSAICTIRRGSPAVEFGEVSLILIPASYVSVKTEAERTLSDISIWKMRGLNHNLSYIELETTTATKFGDSLTAISYPSNGLPANNLKLAVSEAIVKNADDYLIQARTKINASHGSSGGVLADIQTGKLKGLIFGIDPETSLVYALTPKAINMVFKKETGSTLQEWLTNR